MWRGARLFGNPDGEIRPIACRCCVFFLQGKLLGLDKFANLLARYAATYEGGWRMTVEIVVDEDVFAALQAQAEPLVDDANSVLRRLLGLQE